MWWNSETPALWSFFFVLYIWFILSFISGLNGYSAPKGLSNYGNFFVWFPPHTVQSQVCFLLGILLIARDIGSLNTFKQNDSCFTSFNSGCFLLFVHSYDLFWGGWVIHSHSNYNTGGYALENGHSDQILYYDFNQRWRGIRNWFWNVSFCSVNLTVVFIYQYEIIGGNPIKEERLFLPLVPSYVLWLKWNFFLL